jgi:spermidine synthase
VSVLALYLEILLIRWIGTEINIFAYLQNTILVICFLGLGMGCFSCRKRIRLPMTLIPLLVLLVAMSVPVTRSTLQNTSVYLSVIGDLITWNMGDTATWQDTVLFAGLGLLLTFGLLLLVWMSFVPLGRLMDDHPKVILAYSINVAGSLVGIWLFAGLSAAYQPPLVWFAVAAVLFLAFVDRRGPYRWRDVALVASLVVGAGLAGRSPEADEVVWSPYQKLELTQEGQRIEVNNTGYQVLLDLSGDHTRANPRHYPPEMRDLSQYDLPFRLHSDPRRVLIVGAGSGNDAAGALRNGAGQVTAVEIDPGILALGRAHHPEDPYASPRVRVVTDDARSFFARTDESFDIIVFGLLDSHTMTSMTNARLDHYVYTRESLERARSLLAPGGILSLSFEAQRPFIADRIAALLTDLFEQEPIVVRVPATGYGWGGVVFVAGDLDRAREQIAGDTRLAERMDTWSTVALSPPEVVTSDDWPYLYLEGRRIPVLYYLLAALVAILVLVTRRRVGLEGLFFDWRRSEWHFFFLGAAFLLLEVQNISKASVAFGNTWWVNTVILSGILVMVLLANLTAARFPRLPLWLMYAGLLGSCLGLYFVDLARFAFLPLPQRALIVGGLTTAPMFFSGIVFIRSFARTEHRNTALGANLIGSLVGGLLQSITFVTGIRALLLVVAALYTLALVFTPRTDGDSS